MKKICESENCNKNPSFNKPGLKARFCSSHKEDGMIDVCHKRCKNDGCNVLNPSFDLPGGKGLFCFSHKQEGMVDVKHKKCEHDGCDIRPSFNVEGSKAARFCSKHKQDGMISFVDKLCLESGCNTIANYNLEGLKGIYCNKHKKDGMVDVKNKNCEHENCKKQPCFDFKGGNGRFCSRHKEIGMVDVKHKKCDLCETRVYYGLPGTNPNRCFEHRLPGMIKFSKRKCLTCKKNIAIYGNNFIPEHCEEHKNEGEINYIEKECVSCNLVMILDKDDKCEYCNPEIFQKTRLFKQNSIMNCLDYNKLFGTSTDKVVDGGLCGRERPDRIFEEDNFILILECDENQHKDRQCLCEQTRMINITQSYGGMPVYFIRWNPDNYISGDDKYPEKLEKRNKTLVKFLKDIFEGKTKLPDGLLSTFYMYYDGWENIDAEKWNVIIEYEKHV